MASGFHELDADGYDAEGPPVRELLLAGGQRVDADLGGLSAGGDEVDVGTGFDFDGVPATGRAERRTHQGLAATKRTLADHQATTAVLRKALAELSATVQACVDEAVSKTVNLPATATAAQVYDTYMAAWEAGCKGITVYVDGSRQVQPKAL